MVTHQAHRNIMNVV